MFIQFLKHNLNWVFYLRSLYCLTHLWVSFLFIFLCSHTHTHTHTHTQPHLTSSISANPASSISKYARIQPPHPNSITNTRPPSFFPVFLWQIPTPGPLPGEVRFFNGASLVAQLIKNPPAMQETWVRVPGWEDPLKGMVSTPVS